MSGKLTEKLETMDEIMDMWDKDSKIDPTELTQASIDTGKFHSKYMRLMTKHSFRLKSLETQYNNLYKDKRLYYTGKLSKEKLTKYGWEPFDYNLGMKNELDSFFKSDNDLNEIDEKKFYHTKIVEFCEAVLKQLSTRSYNITNIIAFERMRMGG
jgi:hypothetical protein